MDHIVDTIIKLRKMTKPPAPDYIEKNEEIKQLKEELKSNNNLYESVQREYDVQIQKLEEMKQAYIKVDKLFIQQYKKLEKIEELPVKYVDTQACEDFQRCIRELKEILKEND